jgi:hypothetical protein
MLSQQPSLDPNCGNKPAALRLLQLLLVREARRHDAIFWNILVIMLVYDDTLITASLPHPVMQPRVMLRLEVGPCKAGDPRLTE